MARTRDPKSKNSFGGIDYPPEIERALKRFLADNGDMSLKAYIRFVTKDHLKRSKDKTGNLYLR